MKKIILFAGLLFCSLTQAQVAMGAAQVTVTTTGGETIENGEIFTFNTLTEDAKVPVLVTNISGQPISLKMRVDEMYNTDGSNVQLCFGELCYFTIVQGNSYPNNPVTLEDGGTNNVNDHFWNANPGNGVDDIHFKITLVQTNAGGEPIGDIMSFYYLYSPTLGTNDFTALKNIGIALGSTVVKNQLDITAQQPANLKVFGMNGQLVKNETLNSGSQSVDVSALATGVYIARFTNDSNRSSQVRIVKN